MDVLSIALAILQIYLCTDTLNLEMKLHAHFLCECYFSFFHFDSFTKAACIMKKNRSSSHSICCFSSFIHEKRCQMAYCNFNVYLSADEYTLRKKNGKHVVNRWKLRKKWIRLQQKAASIPECNVKSLWVCGCYTNGEWCQLSEIKLN